MLYILFDYRAAILEMCKLILPHGRSSLVPPHFAFPMSYGSYIPNFTILIRIAGFATFVALDKPTIIYGHLSMINFHECFIDGFF